MKENRLIIHIGTKKLRLSEKLDSLKYVFINSLEDEIIYNEPLLSSNNSLNYAYMNDFFLIDNDSPLVKNSEALKSLPANQILISKHLEAPVDINEILKMKQAIRVNLDDTDSLALELNRSFFDGQSGYRMNYDGWKIGSKFSNAYKVYGRCYREFEGRFGDDWEQLLISEQTTYIPAGTSDEFVIDSKVKENAKLKVVIQCYDASNNKFTGSFYQEISNCVYSITTPHLRVGINCKVIFLVRGEGTVRIGNVHVRRSRGKYGELLIGGKRLLSNGRLTGDLCYYFDCGDLKPPFNVYFSGYHTKESFEGFFMMRDLRAPFLLITDLRLEGGAFHTGDIVLEKKVESVICYYLGLLGFSKSDLILSGLSMGTFGAFFYGAKVSPAAIIAGKPLLDVGKIASNARIIRPDDFDTATDLPIFFYGDNTETSLVAMNRKMWERLENSDFSETDIIVAYMQDDDYDGEAFDRLKLLLSKHKYSGLLFSKGFPGRHNDETNELVSWFRRQYKKLLKDKFSRDVEH